MNTPLFAPERIRLIKPMHGTRRGHVHRRRCGCIRSGGSVPIANQKPDDNEQFEDTRDMLPHVQGSAELRRLRDSELNDSLH